RNAGPVGGHGILGGHWAQHDWVAVGAAVALDSHGADIGKQYDWALPDITVETSVGQLGARNQVCLTQDFQALLGDFTDDADAWARAREWLAGNDFLRQAELTADGADFRSE